MAISADITSFDSVASTYPKLRRAAILDRFGGAENISLRDVPMPSFRADEMLVRVKATSANPIECKMRQGMGLPRALWRRAIGREMILGIEFSGTVVATGAKIEGFRVGDDVMGAFRFAGAYSEYAVVRPADPYTAIALKPRSISHAEAGVSCFAGLVALAGMTTHGGLVTKPNARVLVIGASGGVGHLAIQMAKRCMGAAFVVGVCSSRNEDFARKCGADHVVAYDRIPIEAIADHHPEWHGSFDLIFDAVGVEKAWTILSPKLLNATGRFVGAALAQSPDGRAGEDVGVVEGAKNFARMLLRQLGGHYRFIYGFTGGLPSKTGFPTLVQWLGEGKIAPTLAATYTLDQIVEAHRAVETGRTVGKISVVIA